MVASDLESLEQMPIASRRAEIVRAVDSNQITIITAETGAGKSTQVPQYLAEHGYKKIIVTQPRIIAARSLSNRVKQEYSWRRGADVSDHVGYRTAHERDDSSQTVILYCTDGLQLVRELTGSGIRERQVLILDEVHEWNENMEVLVAWAKKRCLEDSNFKVVLMSATIDSDSLAEYFQAPPPIVVPGRGFGVTMKRGGELIDEILQATDDVAKNVLVFLPGKAEIEATALSLVRLLPAAMPVLPLHSQLEAADQQLIFQHYPSGKVILATNIAQTSITIDDIDVVIDSGLERRSEVRSGVEGLFVSEVSRADCLQRAVRTGRTRPGTYVLAKLGNLPSADLDKRPDYAIPEIMRKHIDRLVLRLANINIDIEDLDFYHSPSKKAIKLAKYTLISLGALTPEKVVTPIGREMERFPVESSYARMLVAAKSCGDSVLSKMAAIIAIQEVGGIIKGGPKYSGWRKYTHQNQSDLIAQYEVYLALPMVEEADYDEFGIIGKNVEKVAETIDRLNRDLNLYDTVLSAVTKEEMPVVMQAIVAGQLHQLWVMEDHGRVIGLSSKQQRELSSMSVVKKASVIAGTPFDLEVPSASGLDVLHLVNGLTAVEPDWLVALAPDKFKVTPGKAFYEPRLGALVSKIVVTYNGERFAVTGGTLLPASKPSQQLFVQCYAEWLFQQLEPQRLLWQKANRRRIPEVPIKQLRQQVGYISRGAISVNELSKADRIELMKLAKIETHLGPRLFDKLHKPGDESGIKRRGLKQRWKFNQKHHLKRPRNHSRPD